MPFVLLKYRSDVENSGMTRCNNFMRYRSRFCLSKELTHSFSHFGWIQRFIKKNNQRTESDSVHKSMPWCLWGDPNPNPQVALHENKISTNFVMLLLNFHVLSIKMYVYYTIQRYRYPCLHVVDVRGLLLTNNACIDFLRQYCNGFIAEELLPNKIKLAVVLWK